MNLFTPQFILTAISTAISVLLAYVFQRLRGDILDLKNQMEHYNDSRYVQIALCEEKMKGLTQLIPRPKRS